MLRRAKALSPRPVSHILPLSSCINSQVAAKLHARLTLPGGFSPKQFAEFHATMRGVNQTTLAVDANDSIVMHALSEQSRTPFDMCTPRARCIPAHLMQMKMPRFVEAQRGPTGKDFGLLKRTNGSSRSQRTLRKYPFRGSQSNSGSQVIGVSFPDAYAFLFAHSSALWCSSRPSFHSLCWWRNCCILVLARSTQ